MRSMIRVVISTTLVRECGDEKEIETIEVNHLFRRIDTLMEESARMKHEKKFKWCKTMGE